MIGTCPKGKEGVDGATACDELIVTDTIAGAPCESHPSRVPTTRPRRVRDTRPRRAAAYLNVDTGVSGTRFHASGTPSLGRVLAEALGAVPEPDGTGRSLAEAHWSEGQLMTLGSGSDYTAAIDHLGAWPCLDVAFREH